MDLGQHADPHPHVLAALGVVGGQRDHRRRPILGSQCRAMVELRGGDAKAVRLTPDFVEGHQPRIAVEQTILDRLRSDGTAELLKPSSGLDVVQGRGDECQWLVETGCSGSSFGQSRGHHCGQPAVVGPVDPDMRQEGGNSIGQERMVGTDGRHDGAAGRGRAHWPGCWWRMRPSTRGSPPRAARRRYRQPDRPTGRRCRAGRRIP